MINKLEVYSTSDDGIWWENHPTKEDFMNKINEIIDAVNTLLDAVNTLLVKMDGGKDG